jgi:uncharacterized membrane protein YczE
MPPRSELVRRLPRLFVGLLLFGWGIALMVASDLGLSPWEVFHQGISVRSGIPIGTVGILTGLAVLVLWRPLGERYGIGTVSNVILIGIVIDLTLWALPDITPTAVRWSALLGGLVLIGIASGLYIGAGLGPGPRDGLMTGLSARTGLPIAVVRTGIEIAVLVLGWLLGGTVGVGTVLFSFGIGPLVQYFLHRLGLEPLPDPIPA